MRRTLSLLLLLALVAGALAVPALASPRAAAAFTLTTPTRPTATTLPLPTIPFAGTGRSAFVAVSAGASHTVALRADGTAAAAGDPLDGRTAVSGWRTLVAVSAGGRHSVGLAVAGGVSSVVAVGDDAYGQCGVAGWTGIVAVAAGGSHTVGLKSDRTVVAVGDDTVGQVSGTAGWTGIVAIAAGRWNTVGLRADGTVVVAGANDQGQDAVSGWTDVVAIAAGDAFTLGLKADGTVLAAGRNAEGQCQVGNWGGIVAISAGGAHALALRWDGTVLAAGLDASGQVPSGWKGAIGIAAGGRHSAAVLDGTSAAGTANYGKLVGTGSDDRGQIGFTPLSTVAFLSAPITLGVGQSFPLAWRAAPTDAFSGDVAFSSGTASVATVDAEGRVTALKAGTATITVKSPAYGLTDTVVVTVVATAPLLAQRPRPTLPQAAPPDPLVGTDPAGIALVSAGRDHVLVLAGTGHLASVGPAPYAEMDAAALDDAGAPFSAISAGWWHSSAVRLDGTVADLCADTLFACEAASWSGIVDLASAPGFLVGLRSDGTAVATSGGPDVSAWKDVTAVAAGGDRALGLAANGDVLVASLVPDAGFATTLSADPWKKIVSIAVGGSHAVGLREDGTVVAAGDGAYGQCDVSAWSRVKGIAAGEDFTAGLREDGTVVWTGRPFRGAAETAGWSGIVSLTAGRDFLAAVDSTGALLVSGAAADSSSDASLSGLTVSAGSIAPAFDPASDGPYVLRVSYPDDEVVVQASPSSRLASVAGDGWHALAIGENDVDIVVTAGDGTTRTYRLVLDRRPPSAESATFVVDGANSLLKGLAPGTTAAAVASGVTAVGGTVGLFLPDGSPAPGTALAGTGMILRVSIGSTVYQELRLIVFGDLDGDGKVGAMDLLLQKRRILGLAALGPYPALAADVDSSGSISASDVLLLKRHILGLQRLPVK